MSGNAELIFAEQFHESLEVHQELVCIADIANSFDASRNVCLQAYTQQPKLLIAGNGGSAADAQDFAGELVIRFYFARPALAAIALTTDTSIFTALGKDYGYEDIFSRQIQAPDQ